MGGAGNAHICSLFFSYAQRNSLLDIADSYDLISYFAEFSEWAKPLINFGETEINPLEMCQFILIIEDIVWLFTNYHIREITIGNHTAIGSGSQSANACFNLTRDVSEVINAVSATNLYCSGLKIIEIPI